MSALSLFHLGGSSPESSTTTSEVVAFSSAVTEGASISESQSPYADG